MGGKTVPSFGDVPGRATRSGKFYTPINVTRTSTIKAASTKPSLSSNTTKSKKRALSNENHTTHDAKKRCVRKYDDAVDSPEETNSSSVANDSGNKNGTAPTKRKADDEPIVDEHSHTSKKRRTDAASVPAKVPAEKISRVQLWLENLEEEETGTEEHAADVTVAAAIATVEKQDGPKSPAESEMTGVVQTNPLKRKADGELKGEAVPKRAKLDEAADEPAIQENAQIETAATDAAADDTTSLAGSETDESSDDTEAVENDPPPFRFLDLPGEVRNLVYAELLEKSHDRIVTPSVVHRWPCTKRGKCTQPVPFKTSNAAIFRVDKEVCNEATSHFYGNWHFKTVAGPALCACERPERDFTAMPSVEARAVAELERLQSWLQAIGPRNRTYIKHLALDLDFDPDFVAYPQARGRFQTALESIGSLLGRAQALQTLSLRLDLSGVQYGFNSNLPAQIALVALGRRLRNIPEVVINDYTLAAKKGYFSRIDEATIGRLAALGGSHMTVVDAVKEAAIQTAHAFRVGSKKEIRLAKKMRIARLTARWCFLPGIVTLSGLERLMAVHAGRMNRAAGWAAVRPACEKLLGHPDIDRANQLELAMALENGNDLRAPFQGCLAVFTRRTRYENAEKKVYLHAAKIEN